MRTTLFFNSSWIGQLFVGFGLFFCSFFIQYQVLVHFVSPRPLAMLLCVTLESGKVAAVVWHYYLGCLDDAAYPFSIRLSSAVFRFGLVTLSLVCSMLFLTDRLDRPNLNRIRQQRLTALAAEATKETRELEKSYKRRQQQLIHRQQQETGNLTGRYDQRINELTRMLRQEMDNVVNGVFKGPRYQEIERLLTMEKQDRQLALSRLQSRQATALLSLEQDEQQGLVQLQETFRARRQQLRENDFAGNDQVHDHRIVSLLNTFDSIFHRRCLPLQFVFFFSILISLLMETGIILAFATITMAIIPALHTHHYTGLETEELRVETSQNIRQEDLRGRAAMEKVRRRGNLAVNLTMQQAEEEPGS